jgi:hypothetical protein
MSSNSFNSSSTLVNLCPERRKGTGSVTGTITKPDKNGITGRTLSGHRVDAQGDISKGSTASNADGAKDSSSKGVHHQFRENTAQTNGVQYQGDIGDTGSYARSHLYMDNHAHTYGQQIQGNMSEEVGKLFINNMSGKKT